MMMKICSMSEHDKRLWHMPGWYLNRYETMRYPQGQVYDNVRASARAFIKRDVAGRIIDFRVKTI